MKGFEHLNNIISSILASPRKVRTYPLGEMINSKPSSSRLTKHFNDRNLKYWGKGRNGVIMPLVLNMIPYAHIRSNHAKRDILSKHATLYFESVMHHQGKHTTQKWHIH